MTAEPTTFTSRQPLAATSDAGLPSSMQYLPQGPIGRQVFWLAIPMLGEQVLTFLVGWVDTYLAGTLSKEATAAVGTGAYFGWFLMLAFALISTATAAVVSRATGGGDTATANRALNQSLLLAVVLGVAVSFAGYAAAPWFSSELTRTPEARRLCTLYLRIDTLSYTAGSVLLIGAAGIRAAGDTRTPLSIMLGICVLNAGLSAALVFGWFGVEFGVAGIACGTLAARICGCATIVIVLARGLRGMRLHTRFLRPERPMLARLLRIGLPGGADAALMGVAQFMYIWIIARTAEGAAATANYAAHMIAMRMEAISFLPATAWMTASATLAGQYLGAHLPDRATRAGHIAVGQGMILTSGIGLLFFLLADGVFALMSNDAGVRAAGAPAFRVLAFFQPVLCAAIIYSGTLRGIGDTRFTMLVSLIAGLGLRVPGAYLGGIVLGGGLLGAWCGMWADNVAKAVLCSARFVQGGWRRLNV